jgi:PPM family protein phosphatase
MSPKTINIKENYYVRSEINQRDNNEDSFLAFQFSPSVNQASITVLAIADGMGGHQHGEHISTEGLRRFSRALFEALAIEKSLNSATSPVISTENIAQALESALEQTNAYINRMVEANKWNKAGSTIVVAVIYDKSAVITNLGDSPLYHFQPTAQQLIELTEDHSIADFLGADRLPKKIPIVTIDLAENDILLLCSDGVSNKLELEQIANILKTKATLAKKANLLITEALKAEETDNQTLILWQYQSNKPKKAVKAVRKKSKWAKR